MLAVQIEIAGSRALALVALLAVAEGMVLGRWALEAIELAAEQMQFVFVRLVGTMFVRARPFCTRLVFHVPQYLKCQH
jgi:hypothetical protein